MQSMAIFFGKTNRDWVTIMYDVGVYFGKFLPPHRGHLLQIISASTRCNKLYVIISEHNQLTEDLCKKDGLSNISGEMRYTWLSQQVQDIEHIDIKIMNESHLSLYPHGWNDWAELLQTTVGEHIDCFFCGESEYEKELPKYFDADISLINRDKSRFPISATTIRKNPLLHWDYILGSARPFFAKKILIAGTESVGKTCLTKCLAKMYNTSWSEEVGRFYAKEYLGGSEEYLSDTDFLRIAHLQYEQDYQALRTCNRVCFFDTDATATNYFSKLYLGHDNEIVKKYIDANRYDLVLYLEPDVEWIDDGMRLNGCQDQREELNEKLKRMYFDHGFRNKINFVSGNYNQRLVDSMQLVDNLIGKNI